jgi:hypothetical protein
METINFDPNKLNERGVYSQNNEDQIVSSILDCFEKHGIKLNRYYVEFGVEDGSECTTRILREKYGWDGLLMDGGLYDPNPFNVKQEFITRENILEKFDRYNVPDNFDFLSIDIDGNDFYVWLEIGKSERYKPSVVCIEYNNTFGLNDLVMRYDPKHMWTKRDNLFGASIVAYNNLGNMLGYTLIYANGVNLFFIKNELLNVVRFSDQNNVAELSKQVTRTVEQFYDVLKNRYNLFRSIRREFKKFKKNRTKYKLPKKLLNVFKKDGKTLERWFADKTEYMKTKKMTWVSEKNYDQYTVSSKSILGQTGGFSEYHKYVENKMDYINCQNIWTD